MGIPIIIMSEVVGETSKLELERMKLPVIVH